METTKDVVLVTGASRGIGAATALAAARSGHPVCVNYSIDAVGAAQVVNQIVANGGRAFALQADVSDEVAVTKLFARCIDTLGPIGGLVNNAGVLEPQAKVQDMDLARLQRVFATNVFGTILCAREAVRHMARSRGGAGGAIVNVSSAASRLGSAGEYVDYAASKGAVDSFTLGLAREVGSEGIRVNAVRPGFIDTGIHASGGEPGRIERVRSAIPLGRGGQPREVAGAIVWLLSSEASYTTGALVDVSGGR
jgi:NAD(P)-dependent dehydrogenase (short-subunit alcohol dehydrogenase family)